MTLRILYPKRRRPVQRESREQQSVVAYARAKWPEVPIVCATRGKHLSGKTKFHRMLQGARIKREGYEKGTSDTLFCAGRRGYLGCFIEMKRSDEKWSSVSIDQIKFMRRARKQGYFCAVGFGDQKAIKILNWYMVGVRYA